MKANSFGALTSSDEGNAPPSPCAASCSSFPCADLSPGSQGDLSEGEWSVARSNRRSRPASSVSPNSTSQQPRQKNDCDYETLEADSEWFDRKGQRHAHTKVQKQEWNFKSKTRTAQAQKKRGEQRLCLGAI